MILKAEPIGTVGPKNSIVQKTNAKGGIDRNYYGPDGVQTKQISNNGHGHKKQEAFDIHGEHVHDDYYDEDGSLRHGFPREITDDERRKNSDIL